jgi:hypothetical protein
VLHTVSDGSSSTGKFGPTHEKPYEPGMHPVTVLSGEHVDELNVKPVRQQ